MECERICLVVVLCLQLTNTIELMTNGVEKEEESQSSYCRQQYPKDCSEVLQGCSSLTSGVYIIQPTDYPEPFQVFCDFSLGGWTVFQRRDDTVTEFNRFWEDYTNGFGSAEKEHWLGNERIHSLTSQANYELQIGITLEDGTEFTVSYKGFRLGNESSGYALEHLGTFSSGGNGSITWVFPCDPRTEGSYCPVGFLLEGSECIPRRECACFWVDEERLIPYGQSLVSEGCTVKMTCDNNRLIRTEMQPCSPHAHCILQDGERRCHCQDGYGGDGHRCVPMTDCQDIFDQGNTASGVYAILPEDWAGPPFNVSCNMSRGGGWTVFQRRIDGAIDFNRNWSSYSQGFGTLDKEHWLGNNKLFYITNQRSYELAVDYGTPNLFQDRRFRINNEADSYRLDSGLVGSSGRAFSTYDQDNDGCDRVNCAEGHRGGWWYSDDWCSYDYNPSGCYWFAYGSSYMRCTWINPNGNYSGGDGENIFWLYTCNSQFIEMKIRPRS